MRLALELLDLLHIGTLIRLLRPDDDRRVGCQSPGLPTWSPDGRPK